MRVRCCGVYAASLDSAQHFVSSDDCCVRGAEEQGEVPKSIFISSPMVQEEGS